MRITAKGAVLGVAAVLLAAECALIPSEASAHTGQPNALAVALGAGPVYSQGSTLIFCVGIGGLDKVYAETGRDAGQQGTCTTGYEGFVAVADPQGLPIPSSSGSSTDVVTVTNPGTQNSNPGASVTLALGASSSQAHPITSWSATGLPGTLTINSSGVIGTSSETVGSVPGTFTVTVTATDSVATVGSVTFNWVVNS